MVVLAVHLSLLAVTLNSLHCAFMHGAGEDGPTNTNSKYTVYPDSFDAPQADLPTLASLGLPTTLLKYWGSSGIDQFLPKCFSATFYLTNTFDFAWDSPHYADLACEIIKPPEEARKKEKVIIITHSMGNLIFANALLTNKCAKKPDDRWLSFIAPWKGSLWAESVVNKDSKRYLKPAFQKWGNKDSKGHRKPEYQKWGNKDSKRYRKPEFQIWGSHKPDPTEFRETWASLFPGNPNLEKIHHIARAHVDAALCVSSVCDFSWADGCVKVESCESIFQSRFIRKDAMTQFYEEEGQGHMMRNINQVKLETFLNWNAFESKDVIYEKQAKASKAEAQADIDFAVMQAQLDMTLSMRP